MSCLRKIASLPQLNCWKNARLISTQVSSTLRSAEQGGDVTHTGQAYDKKDYRNVRFTNAAKIVNKNWAIDLIAETPIIERTERVVYCDGGDPHLGHPKVYINLFSKGGYFKANVNKELAIPHVDKPGAHACGYCGLRYQKKDDHHH